MHKRPTLSEANSIINISRITPMSCDEMMERQNRKALLMTAMTSVEGMLACAPHVSAESRARIAARLNSSAALLRREQDTYYNDNELRSRIADMLARISSLSY